MRWPTLRASLLAAIEDLNAGLGEWVGDKEKQALITRRDLMAKNIQEMITKRGEKFVFYD